MTESHAMRNITFICQRCGGNLHDTSRQVDTAPIFDCLSCGLFFEWRKFEWREVAPLNGLIKGTWRAGERRI